MSETPCYWPWTSVVVDPQGFIKPCCIMSGNQLLKSKYYDESFHLDNIESLDEFFFSDFMMYLRKSLETRGLDKTPDCYQCSRAEKRGVDYRHNQSIGYKRFKNSGQIKFLEVTASNICNQTCITCNSYFSTKWLEIEHLFEPDKPTNGKKYTLSNKNIEKLFDVFPGLNELCIKGGEPFSDIRNAKMLERLFDVNPECKVHITSNVSLISKQYIDILKKVKSPEQITLHGSLDHIGKKYEWIRGVPFEQTLSTIKRIYEETGVITKPTPTVSYFNIMELKEIKDFFVDYEYTEWFKRDLNHHNILYYPREMDYIYTRTQEELDLLYDTGVIEYKQISKFDQEQFDNLQKKINIMDGIRGFKWKDL